MPRKAMHPCQHPGCPNVCSGRYCGEHKGLHPNCASPYVQMSQQYMKQINSVWYQIFQVVKENCSEEFMGTPQDDMMELLLRKRKLSIVAKTGTNTTDASYEGWFGNVYMPTAK